MADVLLIVLGAAVGLVGSLAGSLIIGRHELKRSARIRIHRELLPPLVDLVINETTWGKDIPQSAMHDLYRESVLAGRADRRLAQRVLDAWDARPSLDWSTDQEGNAIPSMDSRNRRSQANERLLDVLLEFERFVETKLR